MTVYLPVFHRHHVANARVQSCGADDKQSCLFAPISSVRQFCCRSNPTSLPTLPARTATPKTVGVKELRFFSQIMQVRWPAADVLSRPIRSHSFPLDTPSRPVSLSLSLFLSPLLPLTRLAPTWSPRRRTAVFLSPYCVSQGCCLFCSSIVRIHQRIHSFRRYCLTAALARVRSVSPPTFLSIATDRLRRYVAH